MNGFYLPPGPRLEPGDIFLDIPFPSLKHPLEFFRPSTKNLTAATVFRPADAVQPKDGDTARGPFQRTTVVLLSHGCELDGVTRDVGAKRTTFDKRHWLAAPVRELSVITSAVMKQRTIDGTQPNKFYLPADMNVPQDSFVDLRKITPITVPYFLEAQDAGKRVASLSEPARAALHAHLGMFFSGLAIYVQPVDCPACGVSLDPSLFKVASQSDEDDD